MSKVVALIPARAGSKGVPNKNIRLLAKHPLIEWAVAACRKAGSIQRTIVSTDSQEYAEMCRGFGADVPFLRPPEISGDRSTDYEFIVHALDWLAARNEEPEFVVHIRPTTPLRDPALIDRAVAAFQSAAGATALRSVHAMSESAYKSFELAPNGRLKRLGMDSTELDAANNARQQFPETFIANGYVDVLSTRFIRESGLLHGDSVMPFVTSVAHEVDCEEDFALLEFQLSRSPSYLHQIFSEN